MAGLPFRCQERSVPTKKSKQTAIERPHTGDMPPSMHENHGGRMVAVITACSIVATISVGLRFYVRFGIIKKLGADDWVLAAALVYVLLPFLEPSS
jgi:hypothetical protein